MTAEPIRISTAADAVTVIARATDKQHSGIIRYGNFAVGKAYTVDPETAAHLIDNKGFTRLDSPPKKQPATKPVKE